MGKNSYLLKAIRNNDVTGVKRLLASGKFLINGHGFSENPPLIECVRPEGSEIDKRCDILKALITYGADVNIAAPSGRRLTAAMWAAMTGMTEFLAILGESGADFGIASRDGDTALLLAVENEKLDVVKYLGQHMSLPALNHRNEEGVNALILATSNPGTFSGCCLRALIAAGVDLELRDKGGRTALMHAIYESNSPAVEILLHSGADANAITGSGKTPLTIALKYKYFGYTNSLKLMRHGGNPALTRVDRAHLHYMVYRRIKVMIKALVMNGFPPVDVKCQRMISSKVHVTNVHLPPVSPLAAALLLGRTDIARYLIVNNFFTNYDVTRLCSDSGIRHLLGSQRSRLQRRFRRRKLRSDSLEILDFLSKKPLPLFTLSKVAVSAALTQDMAAEPSSSGTGTGTRTGRKEWDFGLSFREKVSYLGLPPALKRELLHQTSSAGICERCWAEIVLGETERFEPCSCGYCEGEISSGDDSD